MMDSSNIRAIEWGTSIIVLILLWQCFRRAHARAQLVSMLVDIMIMFGVATLLTVLIAVFFDKGVVNRLMNVISIVGTVALLVRQYVIGVGDAVARVSIVPTSAARNLVRNIIPSIAWAFGAVFAAHAERAKVDPLLAVLLPRVLIIALLSDSLFSIGLRLARVHLSMKTNTE